MKNKPQNDVTSLENVRLVEGFVDVDGYLVVWECDKCRKQFKKLAPKGNACPECDGYLKGFLVYHECFCICGRADTGTTPSHWVGPRQCRLYSICEDCFKMDHCTECRGDSMYYMKRGLECMGCNILNVVGGPAVAESRLREWAAEPPYKTIHTDFGDFKVDNHVQTFEEHVAWAKEMQIEILYGE